MGAISKYLHLTVNLKKKIIYTCAADAAFRAVQLKVAITRWLRLHIKEGLYQVEKITARI
jgi:hypothetical protein